MIQMMSKLAVADNSGAKIVRCIGVVGSKMKAKCGDVVSVSVRECSALNKVKKGEVMQAVIVRLRQRERRKDGRYVSFADNAVCLLDKDHAMVGSRVLGPVSARLGSKWEFIKKAAKAVV